MTNNRLFIFSLIVVIAVAAAGQGNGQMLPGQMQPKHEKQMFGPPLFLYDTYYFLDQENNDRGFDFRLEVYIEFANDILQFIKERQGHFTAAYDLSVIIFDRKRNQIAEKLVTNKIQVRTFAATNDFQLSNKHHFSFKLIPGQYKLVLDLTDHDTQKSLHREKQIKIKGLNPNKVFASEIVFADKVVFDSLGAIQEIIPNLNRNFIDPASKYWAYFEIYPPVSAANVMVTYTILDASGQAIVRNEQQVPVDKKIIPYLLDLSSDVKKPGRFTLVVTVEDPDKKSRFVRRGKFSTRWSSFNGARLDLNSTIEVLKC